MSRKLRTRIQELEKKLLAAEAAAHNHQELKRQHGIFLKVIILLLLEQAERTGKPAVMFLQEHQVMARGKHVEFKNGKDLPPGRRAELIAQLIAGERAASRIVLPGATPVSAEERQRAEARVDTALVVAVTDRPSAAPPAPPATPTAPPSDALH